MAFCSHRVGNWIEHPLLLPTTNDNEGFFISNVKSHEVLQCLEDGEDEAPPEFLPLPYATYTCSHGTFTLPAKFASKAARRDETDLETTADSDEETRSFLSGPAEESETLQPGEVVEENGTDQDKTIVENGDSPEEQAMLDQVMIDDDFVEEDTDSDEEALNEEDKDHVIEDLRADKDELVNTIEHLNRLIQQADQKQKIGLKLSHAVEIEKLKNIHEAELAAKDEVVKAMATKLESVQGELHAHLMKKKRFEDSVQKILARRK